MVPLARTFAPIVALLAALASAVVSAGEPAESGFLVTRLAPDLVLLGTDRGSYSNNSLVFTGPDGVLLVDSHDTADAEALKAFVDGLGLGAPRYIVLTHAHVEHIGGAAAFGPDPIVIAHDRFPDRLRHGTLLFEEYPPETDPDITLSDTLTIRFNGEIVHVTAIGGSHDDHELMVHFTRHGVAHVSSVVNGFNFPSVDAAGNALGFSVVVRRVRDLLPPGTRIVSGHHGKAKGFGVTGTWDELEPYARMMDDTVRIVRDNLRAGRTVAEMQAADVLDEYADRASSYVSENAWIETLAKAIADPRRDRKDVCVPLYETWKRDGARAAVERYARLLRDEPDAWDFDETRLLGAGMKLAGRGLHDDAVVFLAADRDIHPTGKYAYYTEYLLARSLHAIGRTDEAVAHCRESLTIQPGFAGAEELLNELTGPGPGSN